MTAAETIERLTSLVKQQADIIKAQADALAQVGAVLELDGQAEAAARELSEITGEGRECVPPFSGKGGTANGDHCCGGN